MKLRICLALLLDFHVMLTGAALAQPPISVIPGEGIAAAQIARALLDPKFCGRPAPEGYACALLYYEDARGRNALTSNALLAKPYYRAVVAATPAKTAGDADLTVLSDDGCPLHITAKAAQAVAGPDDRKRAGRMIVRAILGYQDNESRPAGESHKLDRSRFAVPKPADGACH